MTDTSITAYPLCWPAGWPRNHDPERSRFKATIGAARDGVTRELNLLGATDVVISSNAVLKANGELSARQGRIEDTGVAVYFTLNNQPQCIPCDRWLNLEDNLRAIELTVEALRGLERWGAKEIVAAAFQGFAALPAFAGGESWWDVLGVSPHASDVEVTRAFKSLSRTHHPDAGGEVGAFTRINVAYQAAKGRQSA